MSRLLFGILLAVISGIIFSESIGIGPWVALVGVLALGAVVFMWQLSRYRHNGRRKRTLGSLCRREGPVQWQVDHFADIPVLVVCCLRSRTRVPFVPEPPIAASSYYGSIYPSVQNLPLAARSVGLGGALITIPLWSNAAARKMLRVPLTVEPCCIVTLGWPTGRYGRKTRKPIGQVAHLDRYGQQPWRDSMPV
jgi:nitroreductase